MFLVSCGGGGGGSNGAAGGGAIPATTPVATPAPPATASVSGVMTAAAGGVVSTVLNGQTVTLTVPAGALSQSTTVTLAVYNNAALPRLFQSRLRQTQALPTGTTFITGMSITIGAATLTKPVSFRVAGAPSVSAGSVVRLAGSVQSGFGDIDTASESNGIISEAQNPAYAGATLAGASILYAFYGVASANAPAAPAVTLSVSGPSGLAGGSQAQYSASEIDANGFPFLTSAYSYSVDTPALGTIDAASGILTASTASPATNLLGHVRATDLRSAAIAGSLPVTVLSARPATPGDSLSYGGTFASSIANNAISSSPVTSTQSAAVTQTVAVGANSANQVVLTENESDAFELSTLTTKTTSTLAYQTSGLSTAVRLLASTATDSNNATYQTQYTPTSGLLAVEPEISGAFGPNDASQTYSETDPGVNVGSSGQNVTTSRTTAPTGAYIETTTNADGSTNTAIQNTDGSGAYTIGSSFAGSVQVTVGLPTSGLAPTIPINIVAAKLGEQKTENAAVWYPSSPLVQYTESDTIAPASAYDSRCNVPAKYGTVSSMVTQTITSVDVVYGNLENQTTTAYDVAGVGTVCSVFADTTQTFYDYTGQEPSFITLSTGATPILSSTVTEVLSITGGTISGQPVSTASNKRSTLSLTHLAAVVSRERFRHAVRQTKITQAVRMATSLRRLQGVH